MSSLANRDPKQWGSHFWRTMDSIVDAYPSANPSEQLKNATKSFFESLLELLPCQDCREHYAEWLKTHPLTEEILEGQKTLMQWVIELRGAMPSSRQSQSATASNPSPRSTVSSSSSLARPSNSRDLRLQQQTQMRQRALQQRRAVMQQQQHQHQHHNTSNGVSRIRSSSSQQQQQHTPRTTTALGAPKKNCNCGGKKKISP